MSVDRDLRNAGVEGRIDPQHTARIIRKACQLILAAAGGVSAQSNAEVSQAIDELQVQIQQIIAQLDEKLESVNDDNWSGKDLEIENGGTGASSASAARSNLNLYSKTELQTSGQSQVHFENLTNVPAGIAGVSEQLFLTWSTELTQYEHYRTAAFQVASAGTYKFEVTVRMDSDTSDELFVALCTSAADANTLVVGQKYRVKKIPDNFESSGDNRWEFTYVFNADLTTSTNYYMHTYLDGVGASNHFIDDSTTTVGVWLQKIANT